MKEVTKGGEDPPIKSCGGCVHYNSMPVRNDLTSVGECRAVPPSTTAIMDVNGNVAQLTSYPQLPPMYAPCSMFAPIPAPKLVE